MTHISFFGKRQLILTEDVAKFHKRWFNGHVEPGNDSNIF